MAIFSGSCGSFHFQVQVHATIEKPMEKASLAICLHKRIELNATVSPDFTVGSIQCNQIVVLFGVKSMHSIRIRIA